MSNPFVAEIRIVPFNFAPNGWATCDGQIMSIAQNTALFSLIGTFYGGDGKSTFALPDIGGLGVLGAGIGPGLTPREIGETIGEYNHTVSSTEMPSHTHPIIAANLTATAAVPNGNIAAMANANVRFTNMYGTASPGTTTSLSSVGGSKPHNNRQPYLTLNYVIALVGVFPPRN
jgi:microcystin-dependent protein